MYIPPVIPKEDLDATYGKYREKRMEDPSLGARPALIVVDMTNAFVEDRFPTGFGKTGIPCAQNILKLLKVFRERSLPIIFTRDVDAGDDQYIYFRGAWNNKSKYLPQDRRIEGNEIYPILAPQKGEIIIEKSKPSAFFGTSLASILNYIHATSLIVTGMVTSGCVRATVVDAFSYNFNTIIPEECVADRSQISHMVTLFDLDLKYTHVVKLETLLDKLSAVTATAISE
ncbi:MAG TPA: isochorismatase family protein [Thermoplasmataceae archaeon]|nr:isochorismatase family protein [Thermoplasmatales archaeon AK]HLH85331.1 isochorismatase family protein [Thermoplasmataceae archaeon]